MLRWLMRLLVIGLVVAAAAFVANRLMNREEDFDDFDDVDGGFDFVETPVEIDVPAETADQGQESGGVQTQSLSAANDGSATSAEQARLTEVSGIGPAYEARLKGIGINSLGELAAADPNALSEQIDVSGGAETVQDWITQAQTITSELSSDAVSDEQPSNNGQQ